MLLVIDNYDSFTYNLVQALGVLKAHIKVIRNDAASLKEIIALKPERLLISPGPCTPNEAGISVEAIKYFVSKIPVLGVCLGHQSIVAALGGRVIRAKRLMHGKTSMIRHTGKGIFKGLANPFEAMRYHSLIAEESSLPHSLIPVAWSEQDELMAIQHTKYPVFGVQFHPESIMTPEGSKLLKNFLEA